MTKPLNPRPDDGGDKTVLDVTRLSPSGVTPTPTPTTTGWLTSSGAIDHGRFAPGTILGGRYRVIGRLGRGGMGEVFRADDLKLGQPVALKFLPPDVDRDPARLTQLHTEVRMARQVSHPNVCRVYDIDEVEGHTFLSMEYVDGEDLASLLRRIGHFPQERGLELARQICAGLASAHERGVVHRDLKPANVMLDGAGRVRITDFGLAGLTGESLRAGTPAYMAPEQLAGGEVTVRSDIYALGLVLYELLTGKRAIEGSTLAEMINRRAHGEIVPPSMITRDLSPDVDRAVMRCLAHDPASRPASALAVSAALPGGDPLAAALAAGETPSPEMVAAAGERGVLSRSPGLAMLGFVLAGVLTAALLASQTSLLGRLPIGKSADVLEDRARQVIAQAGLPERGADYTRGVSFDTDVVGWVGRTDRSPQRWDALLSGQYPVMRFWYRTSPRALVPLSTAWTPGASDPPLELSGMANVWLDDDGRLLEFASVSPQRDQEKAPAAPPDWGPWFTAAGLSMGDFTPADPEWAPRAFADARYAWQGPMPGRTDLKLRIEASTYRGRPASFLVIGPWSRSARMIQAGARPSLSSRLFSAGGAVFIIALLAGAVALARANLKSGRADRRGAIRIALFLLGVWVVAWALGARHSFDVGTELDLFFRFFAFALLNTGFTWLFYLGLEPFVRRFNPDTLISWTRVLAGQFNDPRVGRDILIGLSAGVYLALISATDNFVMPKLGYPAAQPQLGNLQFYVGLRFALSAVLRTIPNALQVAMLGTFTFVVLRALTGSARVAVTILGLFFGAVIIAEDGGADHLLLLLPLLAVIVIPVLWVFVRYGLFAFTVTMMTNQILGNMPLTADLSRPNAAISVVTVLLVAVAAVYAFYVSRAGEGLLKRLVPA